MKRRFLSIMVVLTTVFPSITFSAEWVAGITASPDFGYDDNVLLNEDEQDSFTFKVVPTLAFSRTVDNMSSTLNVGYSVERYFSISRLDSENPFVTFSTNYSTERAVFGLNASYKEDSSRNEAEEDTGDFSTNATSKNRSFSPSISYKLTERDVLDANYNYSERTYSSSDFSDTETNGITLGWKRRLTERLTAGLNATASNYKTDGLMSSSDDDSYILSTYFEYQLSEVWVVDANVGYRQLKSEVKPVIGPVIKDNSTGSDFKVSTTYATELDSVSLNYSKELSPSSSGNVNEQDNVNFNWSHQLSEILTANLSAGYRETRTASEQLSDEKRENINFSPSLDWQVGPKLSVSTAYHYKQQKRDGEKSVDSNAISISLSYDWDGYRISR